MREVRTSNARWEFLPLDVGPTKWKKARRIAPKNDRNWHYHLLSFSPLVGRSVQLSS